MPSTKTGPSTKEPGSSRVIQGHPDPWQGPLAGLDVVRLLGLSVDAAAWLSIESGGRRFQGHPVKKTETVKEQSQPGCQFVSTFLRSHFH